MYGYIRPNKPELKVRQYESFRGVYCGLCHELRSRYGPLGRFLVSYDLTFLAMLLAGSDDRTSCPRRCPYHPLRKVRCMGTCDSLGTAADYTMILAWWKLRDGMADQGLFGRIGCGFAGLVLSRGYHRAAVRRPAFTETVEEKLRELAALEQQSCPSLDRMADKFAMILQAAADEAPEEQRRILRQLLYHLGRIVYVLDAVDDLAEDEKTGAYNPLRYRYELVDGKLSAEDQMALRQSLQLSHNGVSTAFELLQENPYTDILSNIIYFGLPSITQAVFDGSWRPKHLLHEERSSI
jgi:hypothetical protein